MSRKPLDTVDCFVVFILIMVTVVCRQECDDYISSLWDWLEGLGTGVKQGDPSTWTTEAWPPTYRGILNTLEIAHQSFVWRIRKQKRLQKVSDCASAQLLLTWYCNVILLGRQAACNP